MAFLELTSGQVADSCGLLVRCGWGSGDEPGDDPADRAVVDVGLAGNRAHLLEAAGAVVPRPDQQVQVIAHVAGRIGPRRGQASDAPGSWRQPRVMAARVVPVSSTYLELLYRIWVPGAKCGGAAARRRSWR